MSRTAMPLFALTSALLTACGLVKAAPSSASAANPLQPRILGPADSTEPWGAISYVPVRLNAVVQWHGSQRGPQPTDLAQSIPYTITPSTHPLATVVLTNRMAVPETFTVDLFIASQSRPSVADPNLSISQDHWPGVLWDWGAAHPGIPETVQVPADTAVALDMDWPQQRGDGTAVGPGTYWAVVDVTAPSALGGYPTPEGETEIVLTGA